MAKPVKHPYKPKVNAWEVVCLHNWNTFESAAPLCFFFILPELLSLVKPEAFRSFWRMLFNSAAKRHRGLNQFRIDFNTNGFSKGLGSILKWWIHPLSNRYISRLPFHFSKPILWPGGHVVGLAAKQRSHAPSSHPPLLFALPGFGDVESSVSLRENNIKQLSQLGHCHRLLESK